MKANACCALTMVYKDYEFLRKWVDYYGNEFGDTNLFVISHGEDEIHKEICKNINLISIPRFFDESFEASRWAGLTHYSNYLLEYYSAIIVGDCDELIAIDPEAKTSLSSYILSHEHDAVAAIGLNVYPYDHAQETVDWNKKLLKQVPWACTDSSMTKPSILKSKKTLGFGGHGLIKSDFYADHHLALFHLKFVDENIWRPRGAEIIQECRDAGVTNKNLIGRHWYSHHFLNEAVDRMRAQPVSQASNPIRQAKNLLESKGKCVQNDVVKYEPLKELSRNLRIPDRFKSVL